MLNFAAMKEKNIKSQEETVYSRNVIEFTAVAHEFCKHAEQAEKIKGDDLLRIFQRLLPLMYLKASLLPALEPFFEDGNEKFVNEADWVRINEKLSGKFGTADDYIDIGDENSTEAGSPVVVTISENLADIYQDVKDFLLLYETGTEEVMNDAVWECRMNFENIWGQKLVNALKAIHRFVYSGEEIGKVENGKVKEDEERDTSEWIISKRQRDFNSEL